MTDVYFDAGQDWMWTTIEVQSDGDSPSGRFQLPCPRDHAAICGGTPEDFLGACRELLARLESR